MIGQLPLCYGPGPDSNLFPTATIETYQGGTLVRTDTFPSSDEQPDYHLTLPPGQYELSMPARGYALEVTIRPGTTVEADWPHPSCL